MCIRDRPYGVVGIISPWNFPLNLSLGPLVEVFAAGNNAMMKLSEFVPETSDLTEKLVKEYFNDDEVVVINGGPQTSQSFAGLAFDHLLFTGSTHIAKKIAYEASENLVPLTLELGGKSPVIVGPKAKMKKSVDKIMMGKLLNAGQICLAPDYVVLHKDQKEEFINEERGNRRDTTKRDLKKRLDRNLQALNTKPLPRNAEQLFKNYADLFFNRAMPKGGVGRKRDMGDLRAFLYWTVLERKYLGVEWLPLTSKQYAKYVGSVPKGKKKKRSREPIMTADFEMLLEALKRENKLGLSAIAVSYTHLTLPTSDLV